jgi:hypothetical protein
MDGIYNLEERLCQELEDIGHKPTWDAGDLEIVDMLAHAMKNIEKIIEKKEMDEYSSRNGGGYSSRYDDYMYRNNGMSYGTNGYSRNGRYNRSGRYSRYSMADPGIADDLRNIMRDVHDENARRDLQKIIDNMSK